jgi:hypothetical protein
MQRDKFRIDPKSVIPALFRYSASWCVDWVIDLCHKEPKLIGHISQHGLEYIHFLCLVRAITTENEVAFAHINFPELLLHRRQLDILKLLVGTPPAGMLKLLKKANSHPFDEPEHYLWLLSLAYDSNALKTLRHIKNISEELIECLEKLPAEMRFTKVLLKDTSCLDHLFTATELVKKLYPDGLPARYLSSYQSIDNTKSLRKWAGRLLIGLDFPAPPWPGNEMIRHVANASDLVQIQKKYNNCILMYLDEIFSKQKVFYECLEYNAMIAIETDIFGGWYIDEVRGINNERISTDHLTSIKEIFNGQNIEYKRLASLRNMFRFADMESYLKEL